MKREPNSEHRRVRGRLTKCTPKRIKMLGEAIRLGMTHELAAQYAGISRGTLDGWKRKGREGVKPYDRVVRVIREAEAKNAARSLAHINKAMDQDWKAASWLLERRHGYTRQPHTQVNVTQQQAVAIQVVPQRVAVAAERGEDTTQALRQAHEELALVLDQLDGATTETT